MTPSWQPAVVTLEIRSVPSGATVTLDGSPQGKTTARIPRVVVGEHRIQIELGDHDPIDQRITVAQGQRPQTFSLDRSEGRVSVVSTPEGAVVRFGERDLGMTPASVKLPLGTSTIAIE